MRERGFSRSSKGAWPPCRSPESGPRERGFSRSSKGAWPPCRSPKSGPRERGFTYIGLLIVLALAGIALASVGTLWSTDAKRERETQLLFVGDQYRRAIASFYETAPAAEPRRFPSKIEELLDDRRFPTPRRHLRRAFADPMTGSKQWGIVRGPGESIVGVYSLSEDAPLKRANFRAADAEFQAAKTYRDWRFVYSPSNTAAPGGAAKPAAQPGTTPLMTPLFPTQTAPNTAPSQVE